LEGATAAASGGRAASRASETANRTREIFTLALRRDGMAQQ
jgi:hypothetical protein